MTQRLAIAGGGMAAAGLPLRDPGFPADQGAAVLGDRRDDSGYRELMATGVDNSSFHPNLEFGGTFGMN